MYEEITPAISSGDCTRPKLKRRKGSQLEKGSNNYGVPTSGEAANLKEQKEFIDSIRYKKSSNAEKEIT